jgi:hypothetical protein
LPLLMTCFTCPEPHPKGLLTFMISSPTTTASHRAPNFRELTFRNCPKSFGDVYGVALQIAEKALSGPFRPPHSGQIHVRSVAQTPFRTVSPRTLMNEAISPPGHRALHLTPQSPGDLRTWDGRSPRSQARAAKRPSARQPCPPPSGRCQPRRCPDLLGSSSAGCGSLPGRPLRWRA